MDARAMFPKGWHPQEWKRRLDGSAMPYDQPPSRTAVGGVRYYFIDFGLSTFKQSMTVGPHGQERAPELSDTVPYDPYKLDVYILGKAYYRLILAVSNDVI